MSKTINFYNSNVKRFESEYLSKPFNEIHNSWLDLIHKKGGLAMDIGAGIGRDALGLSEMGYTVYAVEPSENMLNKGSELTLEKDVIWVDDRLPRLNVIKGYNIKFDLILLSAVWMHIPTSYREEAFRKLSELLMPGGCIVITLRHGDSPDQREMFEVSFDEVNRLSKSRGLTIIKHVSEEPDQLNRDGVSWETVVCKLPDDGLSVFPLVRNLVFNDKKSATYKLGLLRSLLKIADLYPGLDSKKDDKCVYLPLGLVSLVFARQYLPLLKNYIYQSNSKKLAFEKKEGWIGVQELVPTDLAIGHQFNEDQFRIIYLMLHEVAKVIGNQPVAYLRYPGSDEPIFSVSRNIQNVRNVKSGSIDIEFLKSIGHFTVPRKIWEFFIGYSIWLEPVVIQEWVDLMIGYNPSMQDQRLELYDYLEWPEAERTTIQARKRYLELVQKTPLKCMWFGSILNEFEIDHCLPFARWSNNDLWNLMPVSKIANGSKNKSDKIPSLKRFDDSKSRIINWWQLAWVDDERYSQRFFAEVRTSLPGLCQNTVCLEEIFNALKTQSVRLREMQQIPIWE